MSLKPQTVTRRNKNIHIPECLSMVYDSSLQTTGPLHLLYESHGQTVTLSRVINKYVECFNQCCVTGHPVMVMAGFIVALK